MKKHGPYRLTDLNAAVLPYKSNKGENIRINGEDGNAVQCHWPWDLPSQHEPALLKTGGNPFSHSQCVLNHSDAEMLKTTAGNQKTVPQGQVQSGRVRRKDAMNKGNNWLSFALFPTAFCERNWRTLFQILK